MSYLRHSLTIVLATLPFWAGACGSSSDAPFEGSAGAGGEPSDAGIEAAGGSSPDSSVDAAGGSSPDSAVDAAGETAAHDASPVDAAPFDPIDGQPERQTCTNTFGDGLSTSYGRLDGYLVAVVDPSGKNTCSSDSDHLHLQVKMKGKIYDIAVNVADSNAATTAVYFKEIDKKLPNGAWAEGWHTGVHLDYSTDLGLHSASFTPIKIAQLATQIDAELQTVNHISVYATGYGPTGAHLVHRNKNGTDGALVIHPLSPKARVMAFHFEDQNF